MNEIWHPDIPLEFRNQIVTGDARVLAERIPDESIDLIFTDPVYDRIDDYRWLAETAARVLKPTGNLLVWTSTPYKYRIYISMAKYISFVWELSLMRGSRPIGDNRTGILISRVQPCLWFSKDGIARPKDTIWDISFNDFSKNGFNWNKDIPTTKSWMSATSLVKGVILDPFTGGGTVPAVCKMLNRNYIAFEIDPDTAELARERVRNTQPPLPLQYHEQMELI